MVKKKIIMNKTGLPPFGSCSKPVVDKNEEQRIREFIRKAIWECYEDIQKNSHGFAASKESTSHQMLLGDICAEMKVKCQEMNPPANDSLIIRPVQYRVRNNYFDAKDKNLYGVHVFYSLKGKTATNKGVIWKCEQYN